MNKLFKLALAILLASQGVHAENTGNGTVTLAVNEMLEDKNDGLSVEEKIYQRWQEAEGRRIPLKNYNGLYSGLSVMNRINYLDNYSWPLYGIACARFENHSAVKALDLLLKAEMTTATTMSYNYSFSNEYLNSDFMYLRYGNFNNTIFTPTHTESGTLILNRGEINNYIYEYREIKPGVLIGILFAQTKDGIPGRCPWSGKHFTEKIIQPAIKNKKGKIIKPAVTEKTHTGWNNKRQDYKLPNVCDVTLLFHEVQ